MKVIQIGANNGKDAVYDLVLANKDIVSLVVLVEPIPFILEDLKNQYGSVPNVHIENIAICDVKDNSHFTIYYEEGSNYEVSSFSKKHLIDHGCPEFKIREMLVPCMTVNQLLDKYKIETLEHLFIDAEGLDVHILASIDFEKYKISNIVFEGAHTDGVRTRGQNYFETIKYLQSLGYIIEVLNGLNVRAFL